MVYKYILFAFILVVLALIAWQGLDVLMLAFAAILLAILLHDLGILTKKITRLPYIPSLFIALFVILGLLVLVFYFYSPLIVEQFTLLKQQIPEAFAALKEKITPYSSLAFFSAESIQKGLALFNQTFFKGAVSLFSNAINFIVGMAIIFIVAFYLALSPHLYVMGFQFLVSKRIWQVVQNITHSLHYWLIGKVISMFAIGLLAFIGLSLLGIKLALILGIIAGLLTFIPYLGPILSAIPAVLIGFAQSPIAALYVILLYIGIQIIEGYLITPFIEQRTVSVPPALSIMGQLLFFILIGGLGLALATPLIVVIMALIVSIKTRVVRKTPSTTV